MKQKVYDTYKKNPYNTTGFFLCENGKTQVENNSAFWQNSAKFSKNLGQKSLLFVKLTSRSKSAKKHDPNFGFTKYGLTETQVKIKTQFCEFRQEELNLDSCTNKKPAKGD